MMLFHLQIIVKFVVIVKRCSTVLLQKQTNKQKNLYFGAEGGYTWIFVMGQPDGIP